MNSLLQGFNLNFEIFPKGWDIILSPRFLTYAPFQELLIETPNYVLKTAKSTRELIEVFDLRYRCFLEENDQDGKVKDGLDVDEFDHICDHMIIECKKTNRIIGTYRLISSDRSDTFYSQGEFQLNNFLNLPERKLELGRACIDIHHRNGNVIDLLWKGLGQYINKTDTRYLFGCSSIHTTNKKLAWKIFDYMEHKDWVDNSIQIKPIGKFQFDREESSFDLMEMKAHVPSLLRSYISAGAQICGAPALDEDFHCVDYLTILDMKNISRLYQKRYFQK
jgi:putative hemolysin